MSHEYQDRVSLEIARRIAAGLPEHPEWLDLARGNLDRWSERNRDAPGLLRCYAEWREILGRPIVEICAVLTAETHEGQRLRQNSPFPGVRTPQEVWEIKRRYRTHDATTA
ncbi:MAG: hypothetical protein HUU22_17380 [Phycisphaerae bacterium]|nr:hypothetical protein [Phycisphaerae bacterium]NUQ47795.1 hypothetical protein [Phycisphaerae bacterium]